MKAHLSLDLTAIITRNSTALVHFFNRHVLPRAHTLPRPFTYYKFLQMMRGEVRPQEEVELVESVCVKLGWWLSEQSLGQRPVDGEQIYLTLRKLTKAAEQALQMLNIKNLKDLDACVEESKKVLGGA
jgi:hypothetical protein